jgi:hypothetical protein
MANDDMETQLHELTRTHSVVSLGLWIPLGWLNILFPSLVKVWFVGVVLFVVHGF